jgi:hypothetical protein
VREDLWTEVRTFGFGVSHVGYVGLCALLVFIHVLGQVYVSTPMFLLEVGQDLTKTWVEGGLDCDGKKREKKERLGKIRGDKRVGVCRGLYVFSE